MRAWPAALAAAVLLAPLAGAADLAGELRASRIVMSGLGAVTGEGDMLHLGSDRDGAAPQLMVHLAANGLDGSLYEGERYTLLRDDGGSPGPQVVPPQEPARTDYQEANAQLGLTSAQPTFAINVHALAGFSVEVQYNDASFQPMEDPMIFHGGIAEDPVNTETDWPEDFTRWRADGLRVHGTTYGAYTVKVQGSFTLEMAGVVLDMTKANGQQEEVDASQDDEALVGGPAVADPLVRTTYRFLRLDVDGGVLTFTVTDPYVGAQWVQDGTVDGLGSGEFTLHDAVGTLREGGHSIAARGGDVVVDGRSAFLLRNADGQLEAELEDPTPQGTLVAQGGPVVPAVLVALVLVACAAAALLVRRQLLRRATLPAMEKALQAGEYRRAARLAARILSRRPDLEDALIGRAVALSRGGRPAAVVAELSDHLSRRDPSDGVLHYVLGLAYLEMGRTQDARSALSEAVRRTPSLQVEAAARLGGPLPASVSSNLAPNRPEGYEYA